MEQERDDVHKELQSVGLWSLPPEISISIFSRLPVKCLMKCRCVCKPWRSLISTPHFINMHLACSSHAYNPDILFHDFSVISKYRFKKNYHHVIENVGEGDEVVKVLSLPSHFSALDIVDSCNGLICFIEPYSRTVMYVCNPCTGESIQLPPPPSQIPSSLFGFGHDSVHDEYKVVTLFLEDPTSAHPKQVAAVCTLDSRTWRRIAEVPFMPIRERSFFYMDGAVHWMALDLVGKSSIGIGSLDMASEKFQFVQLPPIFNVDNLEVGVLGGCIASMRLLCLLKNGEVLLLYDECSLVSFDPSSGAVRDHRLPGVSEISESFVHIGTLISPVRQNRC
ncbi:hypothetical protein ACHQM5_020146 [Ranunculus cassubicifolius]